MVDVYLALAESFPVFARDGLTLNSAHGFRALHLVQRLMASRLMVILSLAGRCQRLGNTLCEVASQSFGCRLLGYWQEVEDRRDLLRRLELDQQG